MSRAEIDAYLANVEEPKRATLEQLREDILEAVPDAEQVISYQLPAFRVKGGVVAGFAAFTNHLAYLPFSGSVLAAVEDDIRDYAHTKSSLHFPIDQPLAKPLVQKLIEVRLAEISRAV